MVISCHHESNYQNIILADNYIVLPTNIATYRKIRQIRHFTDLYLLQVAFVDYGDTAWVLETNIRRLHPKFIHLPIQAVECTLDGLKVNEEVDFNWAV